MTDIKFGVLLNSRSQYRHGEGQTFPVRDWHIPAGSVEHFGPRNPEGAGSCTWVVMTPDLTVPADWEHYQETYITGCGIVVMVAVPIELFTIGDFVRNGGMDDTLKQECIRSLWDENDLHCCARACAHLAGRPDLSLGDIPLHAGMDIQTLEVLSCVLDLFWSEKLHSWIREDANQWLEPSEAEIERFTQSTLCAEWVAEKQRENPRLDWVEVTEKFCDELVEMAKENRGRF